VLSSGSIDSLFLAQRGVHGTTRGATRMRTMTAKKDFKRRVRERQAKTGESYTAARAHIVAAAERTSEADEAKAPSADDAKAPSTDEAKAPSTDDVARQPSFPVVELIDANEHAAALGLKCDVLVSPSLAARLAPPRALEKLRDALLATEHDPQLELLRGLVFRGVRPIRLRRRGWLEDVRKFFARAVAGIGGITEAGDMLALAIDGVMVIVQAGYVPDMAPIPRTHTQNRLFLTTAEAHHLGDLALVLPR
jgi:hypothetical protein